MGKHHRSRHWFGEHEMRKLSCNLQPIEFPFTKSKEPGDKFSVHVDEWNCMLYWPYLIDWLEKIIYFPVLGLIFWLYLKIITFHPYFILFSAHYLKKKKFHRNGGANYFYRKILSTWRKLNLENHWIQKNLPWISFANLFHFVGVVSYCKLRHLWNLPSSVIQKRSPIFSVPSCWNREHMSCTKWCMLHV